MFEGGRVLAVVPARGGSKGLPRKNLRLLAGRPLLAWPISSALAAPSLDRVIVSTDDAEIAAAARSAGADVPFMRPAELASDCASSMPVIGHALASLQELGENFDYVVMLEPTSPLTEAADIEHALRQLHAARGVADSIVGISRVEATHPEFDVRRAVDGRISPYAVPDFTALKRRQDVEELYFLEGSLYISDVGAFLTRGGFYHERTMGYVVPRWKAFEVDELVDFICIEAVLQRRAELEAQRSEPFASTALRRDPDSGDFQ